VARDRQRAKQRKARRAGQNPGPAPSEPHRGNVPGELDHVSGQVDEFEAALVAGAEGRPVDGEPELADADASDADEAGRDDAGSALAEADEPAGDEPAMALRRDAAPTAARAEAPPTGGVGRFLAFLRASWAELQRVQWPDRRQVAQATAVVLGFVIVAGVYLGVADWIAQQVVDFII
jgi:preprotein translocase subunit SecE